jgi:hypothetical protein
MDEEEKKYTPIAFSSALQSLALKSQAKVGRWQNEEIMKSEGSRISRARSLAFERRKRLPYLLQKGLSKPGRVSFDVLRRVVNSVHAARICVNVLKEKISKTAWAIQPIDPKKAVDPRKIKEVEQLFKYPNKNETFRTFLDKVLEDLFVLDAIAIERMRDRAGKLAGLKYVDAETIRPVFNEYGENDILVPIVGKDEAMRELPVSYVQVINSNPWGGREMGDLVAAWPKKDFIYFCMHPQGAMNYFGYGMSPIEAVLGVVGNILNADNFNSSYFEEGAFPPQIIQLKANIKPEELENLREYLYAELSGRFHRPAIFAGDAELNNINLQPNTNRDMQFMDYMRFMIRLLAAAYGLSGQDVGLTEEVGSKNVAETLKELSAAKGYGSALALLKEEFNQQIIWKDFGYEDIEFAWVAPDTLDPKENMTVYDTALKNGSMTLNEVRKKLGEEPYGEWADTPAVLTNDKYVPIVPPEQKKVELESGTVGNEEPFNEQASDEVSDAQEEFHKSILTKDGYECYFDDRGVSQPFIFNKVLEGEGWVIKPPVAVNLDSQKLEEKWSQKLYKEGLNVIPVRRMDMQEILDTIIPTTQIRKELENWQNMTPNYDSKKWEKKYGRSRKYPYYIVSRFIEGRDLRDQLLLEDMKRVPEDYKEAIRDLANLWLAEKKYVLGDRRADQVLITAQKRAWGLDYQFAGNEGRWKGTKDAYTNALKPITPLYNLFLQLTGQTVQKSSFLSRLFRKASFGAPNETLQGFEDAPVMFGALVPTGKVRENVKKLFGFNDESKLKEYTEIAFTYQFNSAARELRDFVEKNPELYGGIITVEDERGLKYRIFVTQNEQR